MYCRSCGVEMPESATYCTACGKRIADSPLQQMNVTAPLNGGVRGPLLDTDTEANKKYRTTKDLKKLFGIIELFTGLAVALIIAPTMLDAYSWRMNVFYSEYESLVSGVRTFGILLIACGAITFASIAYSSRVAPNPMQQRTRKVISLDPSVSMSDVRNVFNDVMAREGFVETILKGESCWTKGDGVMSLRRNFKLQIDGSRVIVEAWFSDAIFGDDNIDGGFIGLPAIKSSQKMFDDIVRVLSTVR